MEEQATQPSTQQVVDPRRDGQYSSVSLADESDVLLILHPSSPAAHKAVDAIANTSPQHLLQNQSLSQTTERSDGPNGRGKDIALRLSSKVQNPCHGFIFGRNAQVCDIVIGTQDTQKKLSNKHFRIYINSHGVAMLEDTSTNGTYLNGRPLLGKTKAIHKDHRSMLDKGDLIEVVTGDDLGYLRFVVGLPSRDREIGTWIQNRTAYLSYIQQVERQAAALANTRLQGFHVPPPPPVSIVYEESVSFR